MSHTCLWSHFQRPLQAPYSLARPSSETSGASRLCSHRSARSEGLQVGCRRRWWPLSTTRLSCPAAGGGADRTALLMRASLLSCPTACRPILPVTCRSGYCQATKSKPWGLLNHGKAVQASSTQTHCMAAEEVVAAFATKLFIRSEAEARRPVVLLSGERTNVYGVLEKHLRWGGAHRSPPVPQGRQKRQAVHVLEACMCPV